MGTYHVRRDHLRLIARSCVKHSVRGGTGLVFTFMALTVGLVIGSVFIAPIEEIQRMSGLVDAAVSSREVIDQIVNEVGKPVIKWALGAEDAHADYLVVQKPAVVSAILLVLMFALPFLVSLGAFNQLSGDIQHKGLRYLLLRTERANLFFGRFIGTYVFTLLVLGVLMLVLMLYLVFKADFYPAGEVVLWMAQGYGAMAIYSLPYVALCAWISGVIDSPFGSLVVSQVVIGFIPFFVFIGKMSAPAFEYAGYVTPWPLKYHLLHPSLLHSGGAALVMLVFTALFLALGARSFQRRDL